MRTVGQGRGRLESPSGCCGVGRLGPTHAEPQFLLRAVVGAREAERDTWSAPLSNLWVDTNTGLSCVCPGDPACRWKRRREHLWVPPAQAFTSTSHILELLHPFHS